MPFCEEKVQAFLYRWTRWCHVNASVYCTGRQGRTKPYLQEKQKPRLTLLHPAGIRSKTFRCVQTNNKVLPSQTPHRPFRRILSSDIIPCCKDPRCILRTWDVNYRSSQSCYPNRISVSCVLPLSLYRHQRPPLSYQAENILHHWIRRSIPKKSEHSENNRFASVQAHVKA